MAYGTIKVDTVTFTSEGIDTSVSISGLVRNPTFSGNITSTSTISGVTIQGGTLVSGATVTGSAGQFTTITGGTVNFTTITGTTAVITSGVFASGTAAAPSVSVGTTTNGIYSPGANQVAISTGGTGRVFVDASGNVGVATALPDALFHAKGTTKIGEGAASNQTKLMVNTLSGTAAGIQLFQDATESWIIQNPGSSTALTFGNSGTERLRITSDGKVGIGTSGPATTLEVQNPTSPIIRVGDGTRHVQVWGGSTTQNQAIGTATAANFNINVNSSPVATFASTGKVGIGTSSPVTTLQLVDGTPTIRLQESSVSEKRLELSVNAAAEALISAPQSGSSLLFSTTGTERLRITSDGNVGIGTSSPNSKLHVTTASSSGASIADGIGIYAAGNAAINIGANSSVGYGWIQSANWGSGYISTVINPQGGNVGIGTSSPGNKLQVEADTNGTEGVFVRNNNAGASASSYVALSTSSASFALRANSTSHGVWPATALVNADSGFTNGLAFNTGTTAPIAFLTNNTERLRITSDGKVGIGTTSPIGKVDITGTSTPLILQSTVAAANYITHRHVTSGDIAYIGNGGGGALTGGTTSDYVIRANLGSLIFACNGDNERARIDSSGRLLVGTSSARTDWFNISATGPLIQTESGSNQMGVSSTYTANDSSGPIIALGKTRGSLYEVVSSGDDAGVITFQGGDGAEMVEAARITAQIDGTPGANDMPGRLAFSTTADGASSPTERMRINSAGAQQSFSANDVYRAASEQGAGTSFGFYYGYHSATTTQNGTLAYLVYTNGNVVNTNNSYAGISDIKLKENIVDASSQWSDIKSLQVRNYNLKEGQTHKQIGLIAQEVELVSPGLVTESPDRDAEGNDLGTTTKSVNYSVLYMKAVKALQEAMERIETLEQRLNNAGIN